MTHTPERIRFEIRRGRHVIELVHVEGSSYAAEVDGKRRPFVVTSESHERNGEKHVHGSRCRVADLTTLLELREVGAQESGNAMWIELWGEGEQFVILLDDDGCV